MKKIHGLVIFCLLFAQLSMTVRSDSEVTYVHNDRADERTEYKKRVFFLCASMVGTVAVIAGVELGITMVRNHAIKKKYQKIKLEEENKLKEFLNKNGYSLRFNPETHVTEVLDANGNSVPVKHGNLGGSGPARAHIFDASSKLTSTSLYKFVNEQGGSVTIHGM